MFEESYALLTAARNEEAYIAKTIRAVISQTVLPKRWVIASDRSSDRTEEIVSEYARQHNFIKLVRVEGDDSRNFSSKVNAIESAYAQLKGVGYGFLGILDADVTFEPDYFRKILLAFGQDPKLGIAGGVIVDFQDGKCIRRIGSTDHVAGAIQLFRRECYEDIGGYVHVKVGIEDAVAAVMARRAGWKVESFPEVKVLHHRRTGTEGHSIYHARFHKGKEDYFLGYHPVFEIAKCCHRVIEPPYFVGSLLWISGYFWSVLRGEKRPVSADFVKYLRNEQMHRLWSRLSSDRN